MSEEEIINVVRDYINYIRFNEKAKYSINQWQMAIEDLLDLYDKEKEKNAKLERDLKHKNDLIKQADKDLEREYVHIEELENADLTTVYINGFYDGEKKWKDRIREKIKELEQERDEEHDAGDFTKIFEHEQDLQLCIDTLQELLEE